MVVVEVLNVKEILSGDIIVRFVYKKKLFAGLLKIEDILVFIDFYVKEVHINFKVNVLDLKKNLVKLYFSGLNLKKAQIRRTISETNLIPITIYCDIINSLCLKNFGSEEVMNN